MTSLSAADLAKHFGPWRDPALRQPVAVTRHGRRTLVLRSADDWRRLRSLDWRSYVAHAIPDDRPEELTGAVPACATDLDPLVPSRPDRD